MTENQLKYLSYQEQARHNAATEGIDASDVAEKARANLARETETNRANRRDEALTAARDTNAYNLNRAKLIADTVLKAGDTASKLADAFIPG